MKTKSALIWYAIGITCGVAGYYNTAIMLSSWLVFLLLALVTLFMDIDNEEVGYSN